jgi:hypothetical protein
MKIREVTTVKFLELRLIKAFTMFSGTDLRSVWNKHEVKERCGCLPSCCEVSYTTSEFYQPQ